jgi:hypothetical protein
LREWLIDIRGRMFRRSASCPFVPKQRYIAHQHILTKSV